MLGVDSLERDISQRIPEVYGKNRHLKIRSKRKKAYPGYVYLA